MITTHDAYLTAVSRAAAAAKAYYDTEVLIISDAEYDFLIEEIETAGTTYGWQEGESLLTQVAAGSSAGGEVTHTVPMLSLGKLKTVPEIVSFLTKQPGAAVVFEPKLDGLAVAVKYANGKLVQVATRGNGQAGENITATASKANVKGLPRTIAYTGALEVRGEVFIGAEDFKQAQIGRQAARGDQFANSRNAVSGSLRTTKDIPYVTMTFGVYDVIGLDQDSYTARMAQLGELGFITALSLIPTAVAEMPTVQAKIEQFGIVRHTLDAPTDGAVVKFNSYALREELGAASRHPRWAAAFKYEAEIEQTELQNIIREVGRTGAISYVGIVAPVEIESSTVSRVTLNNSEFIQNLDLRIGDTVFIRKANGIIPEIDSVNLALRPPTAEPYLAPATCPKCGLPLDKSSIIWRCKNPEDAIGALLAYAVSRDILDVDSLSTAIIDRLLDAGLVYDLADLFTLTVQQLTQLPTGSTIKSGNQRLLGGTMATKIHANLEHAKAHQPLARVLSALGIRMMGRTFGRRLAAHFGDIASIQRATVNDFLAVEGVAQGRAEEFARGFAANRALIAKLQLAGFTALEPTHIPHSAQVPAAATDTVQPLAGLNIVVTGSIEGYSRTQMTELIESLGGHASSSASSKTNYVVAGENAGSKADKARSMGKEVITPAEFFNRINL